MKNCKKFTHKIVKNERHTNAPWTIVHALQFQSIIDFWSPCIAVKISASFALLKHEFDYSLER